MCFGVHGHGHQHGQLTVDATPGSNRRKSNVQDEVVVKELDLDMVLHAEIISQLILS